MRLLVLSFLLAGAVARAAPSPDALIVAEWISTGALAEKTVIPQIRSAIDFLKTDPTGQTRANAVRQLGRRLVTTQATLHSLRDSVRTFEKGLVTAPSREFCEQMVTAVTQASAALDTAQGVVADIERDTTQLVARQQDLVRPFQAFQTIRWNTEAQRAQVLAAAERVRAAKR